MLLSRFLVPSLLIVLALTACNKADTTQERASQTTDVQKPTQAPADDLNGSPTVQIMANTLLGGAWAYIEASSPNLTQTQMQCIFDYNQALFLEAGKTQTINMIGKDLIATSDEFYRTPVGQKMMTFMTQSLLKVQGKPIEGEMVVITDEDKAKLVEFSQSEAGQKLAKASNHGTIDDKALQSVIQELGDKEKARCQIS